MTAPGSDRRGCVQGEGASASLPPTLDPTAMVAQGFDEDGMLRLAGKAVLASEQPGVRPAVFWAAGLSFSRAQMHLEVPSCLLLNHTCAACLWALQGRRSSSNSKLLIETLD